jgi:pyruvate dehydrogenase E1 component
MLNPTKKAKKSYVESVLEQEKGVFVAVSDNMRMVPDQIEKWVPGGMFTLGTDGFGRSETRENLRRFFEVDTASIVIGVLYQLSAKKKIKQDVVAKAIKKLGVNPKKVYPEFV